jgi:hypothetical protein
MSVLLGLDLGQQNDYSVLSVLVQATGFSNTNTYSLVRLHRFPLKTDYYLVVDTVTDFIYRKLQHASYTLVVDKSGVGAPIVEILNKNNLNMCSIVSQGGQHPRKRKGVFPEEYTVPKRDIITNLQALLQSKRLKISGHINHLETLKKEMINFKYKISESGRPKFESAPGKNDDIVLSIGYAAWYGEYTSSGGRRKRIRLLSGN